MSCPPHPPTPFSWHRGSPSNINSGCALFPSGRFTRWLSVPVWGLALAEMEEAPESALTLISSSRRARWCIDSPCRSVRNILFGAPESEGKRIPSRRNAATAARGRNKRGPLLHLLFFFFFHFWVFLPVKAASVGCGSSSVWAVLTSSVVMLRGVGPHPQPRPSLHRQSDGKPRVRSAGLPPAATTVADGNERPRRPDLVVSLASFAR